MVSMLSEVLERLGDDLESVPQVVMVVEIPYLPLALLHCRLWNHYQL